MLLSPPDQCPTSYLLQWEFDLDFNLSHHQRQCILLLAHKSSISSCYQEAGVNLLSCWYRVPCKLQQWQVSIQDTYWCCGEEAGTFLHTFWSCWILAHLGDSVKSIIKSHRPYNAFGWGTPFYSISARLFNTYTTGLSYDNW